MNDFTISDDSTIRGEEKPLLADRYRIVRQLGQGGMGTVWLAEDTQLENREVAIKMLPSVLISNKRAYNQLKAEALVSLKLTHPNIAAVRAFEENGGNPFLVVDYIDGETLDEYLAKKGSLPEKEVVSILKPIAAALDYAHGENVVHRDVKPGNVMIRRDGHPFILDFGIAREIQDTMTRITGKFSSGTLMYMSPEQLNGAAPTPAQDVYSFAAMVYEILTGSPPFCRGQIEHQILSCRPKPLPPEISIGASVMWGLEKSPLPRPRSCAAILSTYGQRTKPVQTTPAKKGNWLLPTTLGFVVVAIAALGWLYCRKPQLPALSLSGARAHGVREKTVCESSAKSEISHDESATGAIVTTHVAAVTQTGNVVCLTNPVPRTAQVIECPKVAIDKGEDCDRERQIQPKEKGEKKNEKNLETKRAEKTPTHTDEAKRDIEEALREAEKCLRVKRWQQAGEAADRALKLQPDNEMALRVKDVAGKKLEIETWQLQNLGRDGLRPVRGRDRARPSQTETEVLQLPQTNRVKIAESKPEVTSKPQEQLYEYEFLPYFRDGMNRNYLQNIDEVKVTKPLSCKIVNGDHGQKTVVVFSKAPLYTVSYVTIIAGDHRGSVPFQLTAKKRKSVKVEMVKDTYDGN